MIDYPFDTVGLASDVIDKFYEAYTAIKAKFHIEVPGHIDFKLEQFEVFKSYVDVTVKGVFTIKHFNCDSYIFFIETHFKSVSTHGMVSKWSEYQIWSLAYLKKDFGRAFIRRETLTDKIIELVHPVELDFPEDKPFSSTFYVVVNDHQKGVNAIDRSFRNAVMDVRLDDFTIEVVEHTLIIGDRRPIAPERAIHLAEFVSRVSSMC